MSTLFVLFIFVLCLLILLSRHECLYKRSRDVTECHVSKQKTKQKHKQIGHTSQNKYLYTLSQP